MWWWRSPSRSGAPGAAGTPLRDAARQQSRLALRGGNANLRPTGRAHAVAPLLLHPRQLQLHLAHFFQGHLEQLAVEPDEIGHQADQERYHRDDDQRAAQNQRLDMALAVADGVEVEEAED